MPRVRPTLEQLEGRDLPAPLTPTGLVATGDSASSIALTWNAPPDPSITGYDVIEKVWIPGTHGGKGSGTGGHYAYNLIAGNVTGTSDEISGLKTGSFHTYLVTSVNATGQSPYSDPATGETWVAPTFSNGPSIFLLPIGAVWSGPVNVEAGLTTQVDLLISGNPLTYSIVSGPPTASIDPNSGVITYTPDPSEVGSASVTIQATNALGAITQTIPFNVTAADPTKIVPTPLILASSSDYTGYRQQAPIAFVGTDGVTPVAGSGYVAYNGLVGEMLNAGTYTVLATFTSSDPTYDNSSVLTTYTINQVTPAFNNLSSPTIAAGTKTTLTGSLTTPAYLAPAAGTIVYVTINGVTQETQLTAGGGFTVNFDTSTLPLGTYSITYSFGGDVNFAAASDSSTTLTVAAPAPPVVTLNPTNATAVEGTLVTFTAAASGLPAPTVQWQVSTDGGTTWTNIAGATSTTLTLVAYEGMNGYHYRAVFTNSQGIAMSLDAVLKVLSNDGGGGGD
jgi:hypothetical protein